ncbi:hypothetical protein H5203_18750 [Pseudoalteromonas sp. SG41-1]|uniref:hypothetical protein n=1 Tax=Pseudoalteromonas sp. SG41-1 TaxID=2760979 RepID=UPI0016015C57|nr:hypothetical protein [Pseudoalteromonas sp. SG41-1]MBB1507508.1 hypothetical protein [Pseudoalteromonas sp. SG41-1]
MDDTISTYVFFTFIFIFSVLIAYYQVRKHKVKMCEDLMLKENHNIDKCQLIYYGKKRNIKIYDTLTKHKFVVYVSLNSPYSNTRTVKAAFNANIKYIKNHRVSEAKSVVMVFGNIFIIETKEQNKREKKHVKSK